MRVLVVEDEDPKRANILAALRRFRPDSTPVEARSVSSAIQHLRGSTPDLILLDMSLPTFDVGPGESGGRPQGFGGVEVLRYIDRFGIRVPVIVITAYEAFAKDGRQINLTALEDQLKKAHGEMFIGIVYYNSVYETWLEDLSSAIDRVF